MPLNREGTIRMDGKRVFFEAVRRMSEILIKACEAHEISVRDLDMIVPHQANQRIIESIRVRMGIPVEKVFGNIKHLGNTSSNSIPIAIHDLLGRETRPNRIGLCAFGGGFTYGACILDLGRTIES